MSERRLVNRLLIIPAAGAGSRLKSTLPKVLVPVAGRSMIARLLELYAPFVDRAVLVVSPRFRQDIERHVEQCGFELPIDYLVQESPTGMLEAITIPQELMQSSEADEVWITWCDQVAMQSATLVRLDETSRSESSSAVVLPTMERDDPYIHLVRDGSGAITDVLQQREGDELPESGEGDMGLFRLSRIAYLELLPSYAANVTPGRGSGERNFLPFLAWLNGRGEVVTFPGTHWLESVGVNTPEELALVESHLLSQR